MIEIRVFTVADGGPEAEQILNSFAALGFVRAQSAIATAPVVETTEAGEPVTADAPAEDKPKRGRPKKAEKAAEPPADPSPADAAQDLEDETAEQEAEKPKTDEKVYGVDDMRAAGKAYAEKYGMDHCLADIPAILGFAAFSQVPAEKVDEATRKVLAAVEQNPNNRPLKG